MSDAAEPEGIALGDLITMIQGLSPAALDLVRQAVVGANPEGHTLAQILPTARDILSPELLALFEQMTEHRLPGREGAITAELVRLHDKKLAEDLYAQMRLPSAEVQSRMVDGGSFIHDLPPGVPTIWGHASDVVWAKGEAFTLSGPPGVGKTTLAGQVVRGRLVGGKVLGMPITETSSRVLYLAMDRPQQIARALARMLFDVPREVLEERLSVWEGPPLKDMARHPETMLDMARQVHADTVVVDSLKDAAIGLTEDETGAGYNRARQLCLAHGVEVMELHHTVKKGENGSAPNKLEHVYGSAWITAGSGSVVSLFGQAGDPIVQWTHLKQPAEEVGPFKVVHDHEVGKSSIWDSADVLMLASEAGEAGLTAKGVAVVLFDKAKPTDAEVQKARRKLDAYVRSGRLTRIDGNAATQQPTTWVATGLDPTEDFSNDLGDLL